MSPYRFEYTRENAWPPLAWIAKCVSSHPTIQVRHGSQVEVRDTWFCEAIWDKEFKAGDFDLTDLVFGSGGRLRNDKAVFVSSASTVDRLHYAEIEDGVMVSNSLACLSGVVGIPVDLSFGEYRKFFETIVQGIDRYERRVPTEKGRLELMYFRNWVWRAGRLIEVDKPLVERDFTSFSSYKSFLERSLATIASNMSDSARRHRYEMMGTLSSGYDSTTTATLCRSVGMKQAISFIQARGGTEDHGIDVAKILGIDLQTFSRSKWRSYELAEVPFFAADGRGPDVTFKGAEPALRGRVLVTGFHGDKVCGKHSRTSGRDIVRGDPSGLSLCEYRLSLGCIHFPMAYMGVRQSSDIHKLSNSIEMAPWDYPPDYSRPICRRIIEEAGVPRSLFGIRKKAVTSLFHRGESLLTDTTRAQFYAWLEENNAFVGNVKVPNRLFL